MANQPLGIQPLGIEECHCFTMRKAARRITRFYDDQLEPAGLRVTQFLTLAALGELGSATVNGLAGQLDIERTAMGKMVGFLERDGVVRITASPADARIRLVELTEEGRKLYARANPLWREAQRRFQSLNGAARTAALRRGVREMKVDRSANPANDR